MEQTMSTVKKYSSLLNVLKTLEKDSSEYKTLNDVLSSLYNEMLLSEKDYIKGRDLNV